jgi:hypothetical protein
MSEKNKPVEGETPSKKTELAFTKKKPTAITKPRKNQLL